MGMPDLPTGLMRRNSLALLGKSAVAPETFALKKHSVTSARYWHTPHATQKRREHRLLSHLISQLLLTTILVCSTLLNHVHGTRFA